MTDVHSCELINGGRRVTTDSGYELKKTPQKCSGNCSDGFPCVASSYELKKDTEFVDRVNDNERIKKAVYKISRCECAGQNVFEIQKSVPYKSFEYGKCHLLSDYILAIFTP